MNANMKKKKGSRPGEMDGHKTVNKMLFHNNIKCLPASIHSFFFSSLSLFFLVTNAIFSYRIHFRFTRKAKKIVSFFHSFSLLC